MTRLREWLWPSRPRRDQATLEGLRLVQEIAERQIAGERVPKRTVAKAQALLATMPSYEDLYERVPPAYDDWFRGF